MISNPWIDEPCIQELFGCTSLQIQGICGFGPGDRIQECTGSFPSPSCAGKHRAHPDGQFPDRLQVVTVGCFPQEADGLFIQAGGPVEGEGVSGIFCRQGEELCGIQFFSCARCTR